MSKFDLLIAKIRRLRELDKERERLTLAKKVFSAASSCEGSLFSLKEHAPYVDQVLGGAKLAVSLSRDFAGASVQAAKLKKLIQRDRFGSEQVISEHLQNLDNFQKSAQKQVKEHWARVQSKISAVETIKDLAEKVQLSSVPTLQIAVSNYRRVTASLPGSNDDVHSIQSAWETCTKAVKNSGLEGSVKKLLEGAISGEGDPKLLLEDDVSQFLETHPALWGVLKLKLA